MDEQENEIGLQIAPLLDVLFVLLLFFMVCAAAQKKESELQLKLPTQSATASASTAISVFRLDVAFDGRVFVNQKLVETAAARPLEKLTSSLAEEIKRSPASSVIIVPSPRIRYERVIDVLDACKAANVKNIRFGNAAG